VAAEEGSASGEDGRTKREGGQLSRLATAIFFRLQEPS
jgi:hypothetical protein